ncbi:hypothetical protein CRENBAI_015143, partial [Crenichthys baileyi]
IMTSAAGLGGGEGALVSVKVESVNQTSSDCTPHSQRSTQPLAESWRTCRRWSAKSCQACGSLNVSVQKSGLRKPLPLRAKRQTVERRRQRERNRAAEETRGKEMRGEERTEVKRGEKRSMQFHPLRRSWPAPCSQYPSSRRPHSETHLMNTPALIQPHNGVLHGH